MEALLHTVHNNKMGNEILCWLIAPQAILTTGNITLVRVNSLEGYDAVRAAYSSLEGRSVSCCAIEMLGHALVAQTFVTASLGAVFSPKFAIDLYRVRSTRSFCDVTSGLTTTGREKVGGGRSCFLTAFFTRKTGAKKFRELLALGRIQIRIFKNSDFSCHPPFNRAQLSFLS